MSTTEIPVEVKTKLTLTEIGVIISLISTCGVGIFSLGVTYGQVEENTSDIEIIQTKVDDNAKRLERIDANVEFLADLAREERQNGR